MLRLDPDLVEVSIRAPNDVRYFDERRSLRIATRNLPHWRQDGATYFVTFRQIDSIPTAVWEQMKREAGAWNEHVEAAIQLHGTIPFALSCEWEAFQRNQWIQAERTADECHGACVFRDTVARQIMSDALMFFEGQRHFMHAFVVMPNHVHVLVTPASGWTLDKITQSWKGFTAREINGYLGRSGALWQQESFDRIVRNPTHFERIVRYIANNPAKARLGLNQAIVGISEDCLGPSDSLLNEDPPPLEGDEW
jgi:putative transposase